MVATRYTLLNVTLLLATAMSIPASAWADSAKADLDAFKSVPALAASGNGRFKAKIKQRANRIEYRLSYEDLDGVLQAHIHFGNEWENGDVAAFLCTNLDNAPAADVPMCPESEGTVEGIIEPVDVVGPGGERGIEPGDFDALLDAIDAGAIYVNVHTDAFPPGQIRGQLD